MTGKPLVTTLLLATTAAFLWGTSLSGQTPRAVTRREAISEAVANGPRVGISIADTAVAFAQLLGAKALPDPSLAAEFTKSPPQYHFTVDFPIDITGARGLRINSAQLVRSAAASTYAYERAASALDADTTYTRALAARARTDLSRRSWQDADSLRKIAIARKNAGDASELDVQLATVFAGQAANTLAIDSLAAVSILLDLQAVMGVRDSDVTITLLDSLTAPPPPIAETLSSPKPGATLSVFAAEQLARAARFEVSAERRGFLSGTSLSAGFETHDPSGDEKGILPVFGIVLPLPLLNRNKPAIALARANSLRAEAELARVRIESRTAISHSERELAIARKRVTQDQSIIAAANRVASMSFAAYREGAVPITTSLEAQRSAREALIQYIDDIADVWVFAARLQVLSMTTTDTLSGR
jgi:cobalt-zinc-cadmium efflux system outer membrane protein